MKMFKFFLSVVFSVAVFSGWAANVKGSCISNPLTMGIGSAMSVTLVDEYDPELKENFGLGVAYIKITLVKGNNYTVWCTGGDTSEILSFYIDTDWDDESAPWASFDYDTKGDGATKIGYMYAESWDEEDPAKGTYYIQLSGEIGQKTTVYTSVGIKSFSQEGEEENPRRVNMSDAIQRESRTQVSDGDFYYVMNLKAGLKYRLWAVGAGEPVVIYPDGPGELTPAVDKQYEVYFASQMPGYSISNGVGYVIFPTATGDYKFNIATRGMQSQDFSILYQAFRQRRPEEHHQEWGAYTFRPDDKGDASLEIVPGRINTDDVYYYDPVIDEDLCRIALKKGERRVFETEGAAKEVLMRIYDADGGILAENNTIGKGGKDVRAVVEASYDGWYYVGVCDPALEYDNPGSREKVTLWARTAEYYSAEWDQWDPADDVYPGATIIDTYPAAASNDVVEVGSSNGPHRLGGGDWHDWFCFAGRKFVNYRLKASFATENATDLYLAATVYKMVNGAYTVVATVGGLTPSAVDPDLAPLSFTADEDAMYYVDVRVAIKDGDKIKSAIGLDYPDYNIHAVAYLDGYDFALVRVNTKGVEGTWCFEDLVTGRSSVRMLNGASIPLIVDPTGKDAQRNVFRIWFNDADGYQTPSPVLRYDTKAWDGSNAVEIDGYYWDAVDPKDDSFGSGGYTIVNPSAQQASASRTLWVGKRFPGSEVVGTDAEDEFAFLAQPGRYYNFTLTDTTMTRLGAGLFGDAVFSIYQYPDLEKPYRSMTNLTECLKATFDPGFYYLFKVLHGSSAGSEKDSCYEFEYSSANVGTIQFEPAEITVTKDDCYAELKVIRTASEGAVAVRYTTVEGTAKPHEDYYPTSSEQVLSWADGDASTKTIRIRLVPDIVTEWSSNKTFSVVMAPFAEDTLGDGEYKAIIAGPDTAEITIATSVPPSAGEISLLDQPVEISAGDATFAFRLERSGGSQGRVAIAVSSNPGTAVAGTDYKNLTYTVVEWADGEDGVKEVPFTTYDTSSASAKTVNMSMMAVNADYRSAGYGDYRGCVIPAVNTPSWVATVKSQVARNTGDFVSICSAQGIGVSTPIGGWYVDASGAVRNSAPGTTARIGFTMHEAGFLVLAPDVINDPAESASVIYLVGNGSVTTLPRSDYGRPLVLTVPAGDTTVLLQINGDQSSGAYLSLAKLDNGQAVKWVPLSSIKAVSPLSGSVQLQDQVGVLSWSAPESVEGKAVGGDVWYRVKLGLNANDTVYDGVPEGLMTSGAIAEAMLKTLNSMVDKMSLGKSQQFWWRVECAYSDEVEPDFKKMTWIPAPNAWSFKMLYKGSPETVVSGKDVKGNVVAPGSVVELMQGVPFEASLSASAYDNLLDISACVGGTLPKGLTATGKKITGVPSEVGEFTALVEVGSSAYLATTVPLTFRVSPMYSAAGNFSGALQEVGSATPNATYRNLGLNVTVLESGAITAKVLYNGGMLKFVGNNGYEDYDPSTGVFSVTLTNVITCAGYENRLTLKMTGGDPEDSSTYEDALASAEFALFLPDDKGPTERNYRAILTRDGSASALFRKAIAEYAGAYTFALKPIGPVVGEPAGNSILVATLNEDGVAKFTGILADGRSFTCSSYADFTLRTIGGGSTLAVVREELCLPVWAFGADYSFSALLVLCNNGDGVYVDSYRGIDGSVVTWTKDGAASTPDGRGFRLEMSPVGGWYNTVCNLQRYYLEYDFVADTEPVTGLERYLLPSGYSYIAGSTPSGLTLALDGNAFKAPALSFVMDGSRINLAKSVNPWDMTVTFNRALGYLTGSFKVIADDGVAQAYAGTAAHHGVLLMNRDPMSPLDVDVQTAGFYLLPVKNGWSLSQPFDIRAVGGNGYIDWSEAQVQK